MGDDQASEGDIKMKEHRENLLKLIKMITTIKEIQERYNIEDGMEESKLDTYIHEGNLLSLRELTKMFIEELNSDNMQCDKDDEITIFIQNMSLWFSRVYDAVIKNKRTSGDDIKTMKISGQMKKDYDKVYNDSEVKYKSPNSDEFSFYYLNFGKKPKEQNISNTQQPITFNITFTGDRKENEFSVEKLEKALRNSLKDNGRRFI